MHTRPTVPRPLATLVGVLLTATIVTAALPPSADEVMNITRKVADWQIRTFDDQGKFRALPTKPQKWQNREKRHDLTWHNGALYAGMFRWSLIAGDAKYKDWLIEIGDRHGWKLHERPYHADDHTVGQFYLDLYQQTREPKMLEPTKKHFDWILANPQSGTLDMKENGREAHKRWGWSDALFMAPPVWARLARVTGEKKYLDFMDREYRATHELLWDKEKHFFLRDSTYFEQRETNGEKIFWSRGNGWVFGGLALMIPDLPTDWEKRRFYTDLFTQMAAALKKHQRADGTWSMGLLGGGEAYPVKETSGTAFFVFGLAWGVNHGLLDRDTYTPVILKGWRALTDCVTEDGMLGYVQPVGAAPGDSFPDFTEVYGSGAFLAAGAEMVDFLRKTPRRP
ncbi:MAG: glycoside hydrolase family 88 protein [Akkermansiaceae bacterium]|nr:glycoside hydrolase family 88 protein [Akkermansiaceae bacterium]